MKRAFPTLIKLGNFKDISEVKGVIGELINEFLKNTPAQQKALASYFTDDEFVEDAREHDGIKALGRPTSVLRKIGRELFNYFSGKGAPQVDLNQFLLRNNSPLFNYKGRPLTVDVLEKNIDFNRISQNYEDSFTAFSNLWSGLAEPTLKELEKISGVRTINNLEYLSSLVGKKRKRKKTRKTKKTIDFTVDDKDLFFGKFSEISPTDVDATYKYWEGISDKANKLILVLNEFNATIENMEDESIVAYNKFIQKEGGINFLNYLVEFEEKEIGLQDLDEQVFEFVVDFLKTYDLFEIVTDLKPNNFSSADATDRLEQKFSEFSASESSAYESDRMQEENIAEAEARQGAKQYLTEEDTRRFAEMMVREPADDVLELDGENVDLGSMMLDPVSILAFDRNSDTFVTDIDKDMFSETAKMSLQRFIEYLDREKEVFVNDDDIAAFNGFLDDLKEFEEEKSGKLPIFFINEPILSKIYEGSPTGKQENAGEGKSPYNGTLLADAVKATEKINKFLTLLQGALEEKPTEIPQSIELNLLGAGKGKPSKDIRPTRTERYTATVSGDKGNLKNFEEADDLVLQIVNLIEEVFFDTQMTQYRHNIEMGFQDNGSIDVIMSYGNSKKFSSYRNLLNRFLDRKSQAFDAEDIEQISILLTQINEGYEGSLDKLRQQYEELGKMLIRVYGKRRIEPSQKADIERDIASIFGAIKARKNNTDTIKLFGLDVDKQYANRKADDVADIMPLRALVKFISRDTDRVFFATKEEKGYAAIKNIKKQIRKLVKKSVPYKILEVHDSLRILKNEPIYYGRHSIDDYDSMDNLIVKIHSRFNTDISATEIVGIVEEIDSFSNISKSYGLSKEEVYFIKANFR